MLCVERGLPIDENTGVDTFVASCFARKASVVGKKSTVGFSNASNEFQCSGSSRQQYRPCSSQRHSPERFSPFFDLWGHADLATTHLQPPVAPYRQVHEFEGRPGRFTVQKIFVRHTGMPHEVVRCPRIHDMQATLQTWFVRESTTSIVLKGFSDSISRTEPGEEPSTGSHLNW